jgi:hypothetical protein
MKRVYNQKMTAQMDGEFVLFLIGMRINKPWKIQKWWPVFRAMFPMLKELERRPELGLLGHFVSLTRNGPMVVQYWRSVEHLEAYARGKDLQHLPAWRMYNEQVRTASGDVGIWHETYLIKPGQYETIYGSMPAMGLGRVGRLVPVSQQTDSARNRRTVGAGSA